MVNFDQLAGNIDREIEKEQYCLIHSKSIKDNKRTIKKYIIINFSKIKFIVYLLK